MRNFRRSGGNTWSKDIKDTTAKLGSIFEDLGTSILDSPMLILLLLMYVISMSVLIIYRAVIFIFTMIIVTVRRGVTAIYNALVKNKLEENN